MLTNLFFSFTFFSISFFLWIFLSITYVFRRVFPLLEPFLDDLFNVILLHPVGSCKPILILNTSWLDVYLMHIGHQLNLCLIQIRKLLCNSEPTNDQGRELLLINVIHLVFNTLPLGICASPQVCIANSVAFTSHC